MRLTLPLIALTFASVFAACPTTETETFCKQQAELSCRFAYQCCNAVERGQINVVLAGEAHSNESECVEIQTRNRCANARATIDAEESGRIEVDVAKQTDCLNNLRDAANTCNAEGFLGVDAQEDCADLVSPLVEDGDECFGGFECADEGAICQPEEPEEDEFLVTAAGTCVAPPGVGDECPDFICEPGAFCNFDDPPTCVAQADLGEPCPDGQCVPGAFCDFNEVPESCSALPGLGEECSDSNFECRDDLECNFDNPPVCEGAGAGDDINIVFDICTGDR